MICHLLSHHTCQIPTDIITLEWPVPVSGYFMAFYSQRLLTLPDSCKKINHHLDSMKYALLQFSCIMHIMVFDEILRINTQLIPHVGISLDVLRLYFIRWEIYDERKDRYLIYSIHLNLLTNVWWRKSMHLYFLAFASNRTITQNKE